MTSPYAHHVAMLRECARLCLGWWAYPFACAVGCRHAGENSAAVLVAADSPEVETLTQRVCDLADRLDAVAASTRGAVEAERLRNLYIYDRSEFVFRLLARSHPVPLTIDEIIGSASRTGYTLARRSVSAHLHHLKRKVSLCREGEVERYAIVT